MRAIERARVAELADAPDLGSGGEILRGSNPLPGTELEANAERSTSNFEYRIQTAPVARWTLKFVLRLRLRRTE